MKIANTLSTVLITFIFLGLTLSLTAEPADASYDDYQRFRKGTYDFEVETQYFKTNANYSSSGDAVQTLLFGQSYEIYNVYLKTRYDLSRRSSWYGHLNMANATSQGLDASRTNSSIPEAKIGYAYLPYSEALDMILDFSVLIPFSKISENTDSALNSEGVIEATALMRLQKQMSSILTYGYLGGTFRQSRSSLVPWGAGLEFSFPGWSLGGKLFGYESVTNDPDTGDKTQRLIVVNRVNGSSLKFYSVNPSVVDSEIYGKFRLTKTWTLSAGVGTTLTGSEAANGIHGGLSLMYTWDSEPSYYLKSDESGVSSERKVPKFKEEVNDGVNQNLFQKKNAPPPTPRPGSDITPAPDNVAIKRVGPKPEPTPATLEAEGGAMQLKLKKKRKPRTSS